MIWFYIISLIFYILGFSLRSCLYQTVSGSSSDVSMAKQNPEYRERVPTPIWHVLLFIIGFIIPVLNVTTGGLCMAWGLIEDTSQFHLYNANPASRFINKIGNFTNKIMNFLNKSIW